MILAPSVLAADLSRLGDQIRAAERGGAGMVHVDVMDGRFVPNLSLGPAVVEALRRSTALPIDVHLMVEDGDRYLDVFADAGAASISVHVEAVRHLQRAVAHLKERGVRAGVALNPATPASLLDDILPEIDFVLCMSVNPGFSFQKLLPPVVDKIRRLRSHLEQRGLAVRIQIDGGIHAGNIASVVAAGTDIVVAGAAAFGDGDPETACRRLLEAAA